MRELIERFAYRFQLWQRERYGDHLPADPTAPRNPLRLVAIVAVISLVLDTTEPFVFHRPLDVVAMVRIPAALLFLLLYQSRSRWAWHLVVAWVPFIFFAYWIVRLSGYPRYQSRVHSFAFSWGFALFHIALSAVAFVWLFRVRERYYRYIEDAESSKT